MCHAVFQRDSFFKVTPKKKKARSKSVFKMISKALLRTIFYEDVVLYFMYLYALKMQNKFTQLHRMAISEGSRYWMSLPISRLDIFAI